MPKVHGKLPASASARWLACTPSAKFEQNFPAETSVYAEEGTAAHEMAEMTARYFFGEITETDYENWLETFKAENKYYSGEMQEAASDYADFALKKFNAYKEEGRDPVAMFEVRLDFSRWVPEGFGTGDCILITDGTVEVIDFKYGKGVRVYAENNPQMRLYALGALDLSEAIYEINTVKATIFQPRLSGAYSSEELTTEELLTWADEVVTPKAKLAFKGEGKFAPSEETCRFCRAKAHCKARANHNLETILQGDAKAELTDEEAAAILDQADDIRAWLSDLEARITKSLFEGQKVSGWKLVEGRSNRKITNAVKAENALQNYGLDDIYESKLLSLTALEKKYGAKVISQVLKGLIDKPQGKPALVKSSDPRPEYVPTEQTLKDFDS